MRAEAFIFHHGTRCDDFDIRLFEQIVDHQLCNVSADSVFPVLFTQAPPDADHPDLKPEADMSSVIFGRMCVITCCLHALTYQFIFSIFV